MKSYKNFVSESHAARENLNEFLGLGRLAGRGLSYVTGGPGKSAVTKVANFLGGVYAGDRLQDTIRKGDKVGAYNAGAMFIPAIGPYSTGLKLGAMGLDLLRQKRAEKANKEKMEKEKMEKEKKKKEPLKPTHSSFKDYLDDRYSKDRYGN